MESPLPTFRILARGHGGVRRQGTAAFVAPSLVATAFHVIGDDRGELWLDEQVGGASYALEVGAPPRSVPLVPVVGHAHSDLAVLELLEPQGWGDPPLLALADGELAAGDPWWTRAFPADLGGTRYVLKGEVSDVEPADGAKALQLLTMSGTFASWEGVSGAPVMWRPARSSAPGAVIGVMTKEVPNRNGLYAASLAHLRPLLRIAGQRTLHELAGLIQDRHPDRAALGALVEKLWPGMDPPAEPVGGTAGWVVRAAFLRGTATMADLWHCLEAAGAEPERLTRIRRDCDAVLDELARASTPPELARYSAPPAAPEPAAPELAVRPPLACGLRVGELVLDVPLRTGADAQVWRGWDTARQRVVAIAILDPDRAADPRTRDAFEYAASCLSRLSHPFVLPVWSPVRGDAATGLRHYVTELCETDLGQELERGAALQRVTAILGKVGKALATAHERGLVHRALDPSCILLDHHDNPRLSGFALRPPGQPAQVRCYFAPEVQRGADSDAHADVFSLGMIVLRAALGRELPETAHRELPALLDRVPLPPGSRAVLAQALALSPGERLGSVEALCDALASDPPQRAGHLPGLDRHPVGLSRRLVVLSDLWLRERAPHLLACPDDLAGFLRELPHILHLVEDERLELVLNGNFVDLVTTSRWRERWPQEEAAAALRDLARGPAASVFAALAHLVNAGHVLTIIPGSIDVELALPKVQLELLELLGARFNEVRFIQGGSPYRIGSVFIEHGSYYSSWESPDWAKLHQYRHRLDRGQDLERAPAYAAPIAVVLNDLAHLSERYPFFDRLWPPSAAMAMLFSLGETPFSMGKDRRFVWHLMKGAVATLRRSGPASRPRRWAGFARPYSDLPRPAALRAVTGQIAAMLSVYLGNSRLPSRWRLRWIKDAIYTAAVTAAAEPDTRDLQASQIGNALQPGVQLVIMGSSPLSGHIALSDEVEYINVGTWLDTIFLPREVLAEHDPGHVELARFLERFERGDPALRSKRYTFADVQVSSEGQVITRRLCEWLPADREVMTLSPDRATLQALVPAAAAGAGATALQVARRKRWVRRSALAALLVLLLGVLYAVLGGAP